MSAALKNNDIEEFGRLMNASHVSLRDDYEVSCVSIPYCTNFLMFSDNIFFPPVIDFFYHPLQLASLILLLLILRLLHHELEDAKIVITNSKVKHSLVSSAYNDRRNESEKALEELKTVLDIKTLGDLSEEQYEANKMRINRNHLEYFRKVQHQVRMEV